MKRMTLRLKVWQLILGGVVLCLLLIPLCFPSLGYLAAGKIVSLWNPQLADSYYAEAVKSGGPGALDSWQARAELTLSGCSGYLDTYLNSNGFITGGGAYLTPDDLDRLEQEFRSLTGEDFSSDGEIRAGLTMAALQFLHGEEEKALALLDSLPQPQDSNLSSLILLHRASMETVLGQGDKAAALLDGQDLGGYNTLAQWILWAAKQTEAFQKGGTPLQPDGLERAPDYDTEKVSGSLWPLAQPLLAAGNLSSSFRQLEELSRPAGGDNTITGRIDTDLAGGWIILSVTPESSVGAYSSNNFAPHYAAAAVAAGEDGRFTLSGLPDGRYRLGVGTFASCTASRSLCLDQNLVCEVKDGQTLDVGEIPFRPLDGRGTITFDGTAGTVETQDLPAAHHYQISLRSQVPIGGGTATVTLWESGNLSQPRCSWSTADFSLGTGNASPTGEPRPQEFWPAAYGTKLVTAAVRGYDQEGRLLWATDKMGGWNRLEKGRFSQEITFTPATDADRLMLEERYEEAIPLYEEEARAGSGTAAIILANLYQNGWSWTEVTDASGNTLWDTPREGRDLEKAAQWWTAALEAFPEEETIRTSLAECRWGLGQREEAIALLEQVTPAYGHPTRWIGYLNWQLGRPAEALEAWQAAEEQSPGAAREELILAGMLLGQQEGFVVPDDGYYRPQWEAALNAWKKADLSPWEPFFAAMKEGRAEEAFALLEGDDRPEALLLRGAWLLLWEKEDYPASIQGLEEIYRQLTQMSSPYAGLLERFEGYFR